MHNVGVRIWPLHSVSDVFHNYGYQTLALTLFLHFWGYKSSEKLLIALETVGSLQYSIWYKVCSLLPSLFRLTSIPIAFLIIKIETVSYENFNSKVWSNLRHFEKMGSEFLVTD